MRKKSKFGKLLSILLTATMLLTLLPATVFAVGEPPTLVSAAVIDNGAAVELTFDKDMAAPESGAAGFQVMFSSTDKAVTAAQLNETDSTKIQLTLGTTIKGGEDIWLRYTPGTVAAADGGVLAQIDYQTVSNSLPRPILTNSSLPDGMVGSTYSHTFTLDAEGQEPYTFSSEDDLPAGLTLNPGTGELSGTPSAAGSFNFGITVTDSAGAFDSRNFTVIVNDADGVCQIGATQYDSLDDALAIVDNGETITLLENITDSDGLVISSGKSFTIDLDNHDLDVTNPSEDLGKGVEVTNGSEVFLTGSGSFNASGEWYGVYADNATVTVSSAASSMGTAVFANNSANVTVTGDAEGSNGGIYARNSSIVTVNGYVGSTNDGVSALDAQGSTIHVHGNVIASGGGSSHGILGTGNITVDGNVEGNQIGVEVGGFSSVITVGGNVTARGTDNADSNFFCYGAITSDGNINITGNITAAGGTGVRSVGSGKLTIDGTITAAHYIEFGFGLDKTIKTITDMESSTTKEEYYTYAEYFGEVWVKAPETPATPPGGPDLAWSAASGSGSAIAGNISHVTAGSSGKFVAINGSGKLIVSADDGQNWSLVDTGSFVPRDVIFDGSVFIAGGNGLMSSGDGTDWTNVEVAYLTDWTGYEVYALTTAQTSVGTISIANGTNGLIMVTNSSDGSWMKLTTNTTVGFLYEFSYVPEHSYDAGSGTYNNMQEKFVGFGGSSIYTISRIGSETTFRDISPYSDTTVQYFNNVWYEPYWDGTIITGKFYATRPVSSETELLSSLNGKTGWTLIGTYSSLNGYAGYAESDAGTLVKVGESGTILTSYYGTDWTAQTVGTYDLNDVIYTDGIFVAVGDHGTILTSADGETWHSCTSGTAADLLDAEYGGGTYLASGNGVILRSGDETPPAPDTVINISAISGVTPPVRGMIPVTAVTETAQYTGTVIWSPAHNPFLGGTVYTATITLIPKAGYTLNGVNENLFTVAGATATNAANTGVVTAVFLATEAAPVTAYTVTFNSNGSVYVTKTVNAGESIGSAAWPTDPTRNSYTFGGWFTGANGSGTQFTPTTPVNATMTVYAKWTYSGGGGSSNPSTPTYNADVKAGNSAETTLPVTVDKDVGTASIDAGSQNLAQGGTVITVPSIPDVDTYLVGIPVPDLSTTVEQGTLTLDTKAGSVTVPSNMLTVVSGISGNKAVISIGEGDKAGLPADVKTVIGDKPVIQLTLSIDGKQTDWSNPNAPVTVSIPYTPTAAELANPESIVIWYIDGSGKALSVPNGHYDPATGMVTFSTTHFSDYAVAYNKVSFNDVASGAWYNKAVSFIAAREITSGNGNGNYGPNAKLTRGEFIVMMMRAYGIAPDTNPADNFADAGNTYYTGYLAAAKRLGISSGVGNNMYAPGKEITRQEMFTLLYYVLKVIGQLPQGDSGKTLNQFTDAGQIASWAKDAMTLLVKTRTVGGSGGKLNPLSTTTRAEMAQVLYNLLEK